MPIKTLTAVFFIFFCNFKIYPALIIFFSLFMPAVSNCSEISGHIRSFDFDNYEINILNFNGKLERIKVKNYLKSAVIAETLAAGAENYKLTAVLIRTLAYSEYMKNADYKITLKTGGTVYPENMPRHYNSNFLLCSKTHCVSFKKCDNADKLKSAEAAVVETENKILTSGAVPVEIFFSANCGGYSHTPSELYGANFSYPYYQASGPNRCPCQTAGRREWTSHISKKFLEKFSGVEIGSCEIFQNPYQIIINGKISINYDKLMHLIENSNYNRIKSPNFKTTIAKNSDSLIFYGTGIGHGIGLCQKGADILEKNGLNYTQILEFYYPGCEIKKIENTRR